MRDSPGSLFTQIKFGGRIISYDSKAVLAECVAACNIPSSEITFIKEMFNSKPFFTPFTDT